MPTVTQLPTTRVKSNRLVMTFPTKRRIISMCMLSAYTVCTVQLFSLCTTHYHLIKSGHKHRDDDFHLSTKPQQVTFFLESLFVFYVIFHLNSL